MSTEDLRWSAWMPLMAAHPLALAQLPSSPGLYRIRRVDRPDGVIWVGWERRGVRETVERLSRQVHLPVEPFDDPDTPARLLWTLRRTQRVHFEVSGAALPADDSVGRDVERLLRVKYMTTDNCLTADDMHSGSP